MWGIVLFLTLWLVSTGMRAGFGAMLGVASFTSEAAQTVDGNWELLAQEAGVSRNTIKEWKQDAADLPEQAEKMASNPANREAVQDYATAATWYTLLGTLLSMGAAVLGAIIGAGPTFRLLTIPRTRARYVNPA